MKKITVLIMVMVMTIASVFATTLPTAPSSVDLKFNVTGTATLLYGFQHDATNGIATSFVVGSTASDGTGITANTTGYALSLMDCSKYNDNSEYTLYITLGIPGVWTCASPSITGTTNPTINDLVAKTAVNGVTASVVTDNSKIKVVYSAVTTKAGIIDRSTAHEELASFNIQWEAENVPVGTYTSTMTVSYTTT